MIQKPGYAGKILKVDLSTSETTTIDTDVYAHRFIGGRGIAAKIHWDEVSGKTGPFDPDNRLVFMTGPACGVPGFAGSRWHVSGKSPLSNQFTYCNLGGDWGAHLKFAGFDGLVVYGKAVDPVYLIIDNGTVEVKSAAHLKGKGAIRTREILKDELGKAFRVVAVGPAGENRVVFATLLADGDSSGSGGLGAVMGGKNLKAVAVKGDGAVVVADREKAAALRKKIKAIKGGRATMMQFLPEKPRQSVCFGCINGCQRNTYTAKDGTTGKSMCHSGMFYFVRAMRYYKEKTEVPFAATKFCDDFGLDSYPVDMAMKWLLRCQKAGLLTDDTAGIPISKIGSLEFIETLTKKIAFREGLGDQLANGVRQAAISLGMPFEEMITDYLSKSGEMQVYDPRLYLTTGLFWAMEPRLPIQQLHEIIGPLIIWAAKASGQDFMGMPLKDNYMTSDVVRGIGKKFWGSEIAADFSTYDGKAKAAMTIQDRQALHESIILCDMSWPVIHSPSTPDHLGDPTLGHEVFSVITGRDADEATMEDFGSRIFTLQRANQIRDGHRGTKDDVLPEFHFTTGLKFDFANDTCIVPGKDGEIFSRKGMVVERDAFENMKAEYYQLRGWDVKSGLLTADTLKNQDLEDVADDFTQL